MERYYDDEERNYLNNPLKIIESGDKRIVDFYLINTIDDIKDYIDFLRAVESCRPKDEIIVHINNYGGDLDVGWNIYDSLRLTDAMVTINVEGACASCASMIMLAGDEWNINPHSWVMVHSWSGAEWGKWNEIKAKFKFDESVVEKRFREMYKNFMTDEEIEDCLKGKDFYFDDAETMKRLKIYKKEEIDKQEIINKISEKYTILAQKEIDNRFKKLNKKK